jgi:GT2 family glycosyltransferase
MARVTAPRRFAAPQSPLVSIIIPVYGKWNFTRTCLTALHGTASKVPFEIVVVDDKSPDASLRRLRRLHGIKVVALPENKGYVGACNAGIEAAGGELIVFLNNDTRVTPGWLDPLVERLQDPTIGLAGAKLIYPDGTLQDAGGIVFSDGSAWNYGKHQLATAHDYVYMRDADYVSGACTIVRRETLDQLGGGLDPLFAPAYYDDTDLAFGVRSLGLRVVYEPRSVVVHDEGVSHGTDENKGVKRYQVVNQAKFVSKWTDALAEQCDRDPEVVPWAARRRAGQDIVVVIDDIIPTPDVDSGSVRRFASLIGLKKLGYHVILAPDSAGRTEPHASALLAHGVEILDPLNDLQEELAPLRDHIAAVILARAPVAVNHLADIRRLLPDVPIIFDTVDLHYVREMRAREVEGLSSDSADVQFLRDIELALIRGSDLTLVVSPVEQELLHHEAPDSTVQLLSNVHAMPGEPAGPSARSGVLFVGSFAHQPNVDAVRWYLDAVHPLVKREIGDYPVRIVGRGSPSELEARADGDSGVEFVGWIADLAPEYANARMAIAPLRYGAGVKGKIGEALSHGVPTVMTSVGSEGMDLRDHETALIADDPEGFAAQVVALMRDDALWSKLSSNGRRHVAAAFGEARFLADLKAAMERVTRP